MAITFTPSEIAAYYSVRVPGLKQRSIRQWRGPCPIHDGQHDNFAVDPQTGLWYCHSQCQRGGDILDLERELCGGDFRECKAQVYRVVGRDLEPYYRAAKPWRRS